jgi:outer membrane protein assembly factor BamB
MNNTLCRSLAILFGLAVPFAAGVLPAEDWPQWRGPRRDGTWNETGLVDRFSSASLTPLWSAEVANGYSGPTVATGRVYLTDRLAESRQERVLCFDAKTGTPLWVHAYACEYTRLGGYQDGPRASVSIDGGLAYSLGAMGHLFCLDAATGSVVWQRDLDADYQVRWEPLIWGVSASPLVEGDLLIVQVGGENACLVAFDKKTGDEKWKALDDRASYSAPIVVEQAGRRVLVCWTGDNVVGLDPGTGTVHWSVPFKPRQMVLAVATPVVHDNSLFLTGFYDGSLLVRLSQDRLEAREVWRRAGESERNTDALHSIISTPLLAGGYAYGVDSYGELRCLDLKNGDRVWESQQAVPRDRWSTIHFVRNQDRIWMFNERGELIIARLTPQGYEEVSRATLIAPTTGQLRRRQGGVTWSHPAFADRRVYARSDRELVCASLAAD